MDFRDPDCPLPWQGGGGGPDVQIPCSMELCAAAAVCLLRSLWEARPSCDEEGEWARAGGGAGLLDLGLLEGHVSLLRLHFVHTLTPPSPTPRAHSRCSVLCPQEGDWANMEGMRRGSEPPPPAPPNACLLVLGWR